MLLNLNKEDEYLYQGKRKRLVEQLKEKGIVSKDVLNAILKIPRHLFFDQSTERPALLDHAYSDKALKIGAGQTISHPFTVAFQTEKLNINKGDKILEIGTGCGYQTAVLLEMGAKVYSIERQKELFDKTKVFVPKLGYKGAKLVYGDGYKGLPQFAPFDKIIVTAGAPLVPETVVSQLKIGGVLVIPVGDNTKQRMLKITRTTATEIDTLSYDGFAFVPLIGEHGWS